MDWTKAISDVVNFHSFSSLWYWIVIAVLWSSVSHWVLGVPFDLISRARRHGGEAEQDLIDVVRVNVHRLLHITQVSGTYLLAFVCFALSSMFILAIYYRIELAQALLFIFFPLSIIGSLSVSAARDIEANATDAESLYRMLNRHRLWTQVIGMVSIFFTAMYGMYHNLDVPAWF